jgi:hypothetical protein
LVLALAVPALILAATSIKRAPQGYARTPPRFGRYACTLELRPQAKILVVPAEMSALVGQLVRTGHDQAGARPPEQKA